MVSIYSVLSLVTLFSSFTETLGSEETKILDDILAEMNQMREMDQVMDNRMEKLIRQVENLRDSHILTNTTTPTLPLRTTTPNPSTARPQTSSATPPPLPSVCSSYRRLTDSWRHIDYINRGRFPCHCDRSGRASYDSNLAWGSWYRFTGAAGTKLPTAPAPVGGGPSSGNFICGTHAVAYISSGGNPTIQDGIVTRDVCFEWGSSSCYGKTTVKVAACRDMHGDYFVYQLQPAPGCYHAYYAYCAID